MAAGGIIPHPDAMSAYRGQYRDAGTGIQRYSGTTWVGVATELIPWTRPRLATGYGTNGNSNIAYRVIELVGTRFIQWRGGTNISYSGGVPAHEGRWLAAPLPATARPASLRTVPAACSAADSTVLAVKADFRADGTAQVIARAGSTPPWVSFNGLMYPA